MRIRLTLFLLALLAAAHAFGLFLLDFYVNRELRPVRAEIIDVETEYRQRGDRQYADEYATFRWQVRDKVYKERKRIRWPNERSRVFYYYRVGAPNHLKLERDINALPAALGTLVAAMLLILPSVRLWRSGSVSMTRAHWLAFSIPLALLPPLYLLFAHYLDTGGWDALGAAILTALVVLAVSSYLLVCVVVVPQLAHRHMRQQSANAVRTPS